MGNSYLKLSEISIIYCVKAKLLTWLMRHSMIQLQPTVSAHSSPVDSPVGVHLMFASQKQRLCLLYFCFHTAPKRKPAIL